MSFDILSETGIPLLTESGDNLVTELSTPGMTCDFETALADARLIDCCIPRGMQWAVVISLLCQLNDMSCDAPTLLDDARCIDQCIPDGSKLSVIISLLCQFTQGGGGGGGVQVFSGHYDGEMPTTPTPAASVTAAFNYDLDAPFKVWKWSGTDWSG